MRIARSDSSLPPVERGKTVVVRVDGQEVTAFEGEMISTVLLAQGIRGFRHTTKTHQPRGIFCGMGVCYDCLVTVDGAPNVRACMTTVRQGMAIETRGETQP